MKANGIARLGLGCALALSMNTVHAKTLGEPWISEVGPDPATIPDTDGDWFEPYNPAATPFNLNGSTLGDDGRDLHRIETDLLILPGEYLTLACSAAPGFSPNYGYPSFTLCDSSDEIVLRDPLGEALRLGYGASFDAPGRSRELLTLPVLATSFGLTSAELVFDPGDIGAPGFADLLPAPLPAGARLFITGVPATFTSSRGARWSSRGSQLPSRGLTAGSSVEAKFQGNRLTHRNHLTNGEARAQITVRPGLICRAVQISNTAIWGLAT